MKSRTSLILVFITLLALLLAACGGGDEVDTSTFKQATDPALGITMGYPEDWLLEDSEEGLQLATSQELFDNPDNVTEGALMVVTGFDRGMLGLLSEEEVDTDDPVALLQVFSDLIFEDDETVTAVQEAQAVTYNNVPAATMTIHAKNDQDKDMYAELTAVPNDSVVVYIMAVTLADQEEEMHTLFQAMYNTIELSAPEMASGEETEAAGAEEAEAEEAAPEPTAEPTATPLPEPTATAVPTEAPDPTASFAETTAEIIGFAISHPEGWVTDMTESGDLRLASDAALLDDPEGMEEGMVVQVTNLPLDALVFIVPAEADPNDPVAVLTAFIGVITGIGDEDNPTTFTEREAAAATTIAGYDAATAVYEVDGEELVGLVKFVAISDPENNRVAFLFAATPSVAGEESLAVLDSMLDTVVLTAPSGTAFSESGGTSERISQYAHNASASTEYSDDSWSAAQATGAPDTFECGDQTTAWASSASSGVDWLELTYGQAVYATQINIHQTYNPTQVVEVELITPEGEAISVYSNVPADFTETCPYILTIDLDADVLASGVRVHVDQSQLALGWNEIDAVQLVGIPSGEAGTTGSGGGAVTGGSAIGMVGSGGTAVVRDDVPRPTLESGLTMFSNGNEVFDIVVHDGLIYAATGGGLVAWDYASGEPVGKWTTLDGLGHNVAKSITVCSLPQERVVIGTRGGLSLYDPASDTFENWTTANSGMSSDAGVQTVECAPQGNALVIGYDLDGVDVFEAASDTWTYYGPFDALESGFAEAIAIKGNLDEIWVAHIAAVSRINHRLGTIDYYNDAHGLDDAATDDFEDFVEDIVVDGNGTVWFAQGGGLTRVDGDGMFTFITSEDIPGWPFWSGTDDLALGANGTIWTNDSLGGVCQFDPQTTSCLTSFEDEPGMANDFNNGLYVDGSGQIFYGSEGGGVSYFDGAAWQNFLLEEAALSNEYKAIAQGADGSIWVGGYDGGQKFFAYDVAGTWEDLGDHLSWYGVSTFYPEADGMWIGHTGGASFYNYDTGEWTDLESADAAGEGIYQGEVTAVVRDSQGRLWFGTGGGVTVWDGDTFTYFDLLTDTERNDGRSARWVYDILVEGDNVWVGGVSALYRFDATDGSLQTFTRWDEANGLPGFFPSVFALGQGPDGHVLAAVDGNLLVFDGEDGFDEIYDAGSNIRSITVDDEGVIAVGTESDGLHINLDGEWVKLTTADGLPSNELAGRNILIDYLETLWVAASEGGIVQIVP